MAHNPENPLPHKLRITLLGAPSAQMNGKPITGFVSNKATALLYYLAATRQSHTREALAGLFWGDYTETKARKNLRDVLSNLRRLLGDCLDISRQTVGLSPAVYYAIDLERVETTLKELQEAKNDILSPTAMLLLQEAVDLCQGDFLDGFYITQAPDFEMWLVIERSRLQQLAIQALLLLTEHLTYQGNTALGIKYSTRLLALEPWREETHRQLMQLLVWSGQRSAALAQYEACRRILAENLSVEPELETRQLYERILRGDAILAHSVSMPAETAQPFRALLHNLPAQLTRFVGREGDMAEINGRLRDPDCRLVTLTGPGGVGKTRLALQAAQMLLPEAEQGTLFCDGIFFVRLASVEHHDLEKNYNPVAAAIADALQLTLTDPEAPTSRIQNYLREKELLLVMDNFEHLAAAAGYLTLLLAAAPRLKMLVTSRSRLNLRGEQVYLLDGLPFPAEATDSLAWHGYGAVQLFLQTARAIDAGFALSSEEDTAVTRICRLVNGLPLGIELAASWVHILSCTEILQELEQNLRFLRASMSDMPERHRSLWAVFTYSWNMLTAEEQRTLRQLSVFRGGFTREAAEQVADASLPILSKLVDHSFVRRGIVGQGKAHFELLEIMRLYAAEHLQQNPAEGAAVYDRHRDYYMTFLAQIETRLQGEEQRRALDELSWEIENIRSAWRWSVVQQDVAALDKGLVSLFDYYDMRSRFQEGRDAFQRAATAVDSLKLNDRETTLVWGRLLARQGWFTFHAGRYPEARQLLQQSVEVIRPLNSPTDLVFCLNYQGALAFHLGDDTLARELCLEALALSQETDYQPGTGIALNILSQIAYHGGDYETALTYGRQSLEIVTRLGNPWSKAFSLANLALVAFARQEYDEARQLDQTILEIREQMGDVRGVAMCLEQLALTAVAQQNSGDALALYQRSLALYREIGNQRGTISTMAGLGRIALQQEAYELARTYFADALNRAIQLQNVPELPPMVFGLATALRKLGKGETAVALENLFSRSDPDTSLAALAALLAKTRQ